MSFIDMHRGEHGVEPICNVLPIAPSTYYDHLGKRADPTRLSDRARRDAALQPEILRVKVSASFTSGGGRAMLEAPCG
ncbi:hypothetical protein [Palleronia marisminoris]|uniref:hypothetical protein n=1 Tax=Palleronia marisminoris TaxID=315423 RepID=UPI003522A3D0